MNLFTRKMRLFCVSNIVVSFVCTGFLGINGYNPIESPEENAHEISLTASDTEPVSHNGEEEKREDTLAKGTIVSDKTENKKIEETKTVSNITNKKTNTKSKSTTKKTTTNVVTKKEVKKTVTYAPAAYSSVTGDAIVNYARRYLGLRYKSGTPSLTNGSDCSGFTMLIFREFGVSLPRTVSGQIGRGTYVNKKDLQKGDLVFYKSRGSRGGASHVAIYIGGGQVIHESRPGVGVKISSVNMMQYVTARRVINSKAKEIAEKKLEEQKQEETITDNSSNNAIVDTTNNQTTAVQENIDNNINNNVNDNVENSVDNNVNTAVDTNSNEVITEPIKEEIKEENKTVEIKEESKDVSEDVNSQ